MDLKDKGENSCENPRDDVPSNDSGLVQATSKLDPKQIQRKLISLENDTFSARIFSKSLSARFNLGGKIYFQLEPITLSASTSSKPGYREEASRDAKTHGGRI